MVSSLALLGSTGSIGVQALDIIAENPQRFSVFALTAQQNDELLFQQCLKFQPNFAVLTDPVAGKRLIDHLKNANSTTQVLIGESALNEVASMDEVDAVLSAIVGAAALLPTMSALTSGKRVLLANKESLVMAGGLMMSAVKKYGAELLPIDSEHNAVFQCFPDHFMPGSPRPEGVDSIVLTASGGPFRTLPISEFSSITPEQAVVHPNWSMGSKISVDSATMMNKGLEVIEAAWLFDLPVKDIEVLIHPQSLFHAFVRYRDGSVISHVAPHDMHIPIAHVLSWPERISSGALPLDFASLSQVEFSHPDPDRYPCLSLAYEAMKTGGTATTILNAANEMAVASFLARHISFDQIAVVVAEVLDQVSAKSVDCLETIIEADHESRRCFDEILTSVA